MALNSINLILCMHVRPRTFLCGTSKSGDAEEIYADNAQLNDGALFGGVVTLSFVFLVGLSHCFSVTNPCKPGQYIGKRSVCTQTSSSCQQGTQHGQSQRTGHVHCSRRAGPHPADDPTRVALPTETWRAGTPTNRQHHRARRTMKHTLAHKSTSARPAPPRGMCVPSSPWHHAWNLARAWRLGALWGHAVGWEGPQMQAPSRRRGGQCTPSNQI